MGAVLNCECLVCKTKFHLKQSAINKGKGKYCSKSCSNLDRSGVATSEYKCQSCGIIFSKKSKKEGYKFCSIACHASSKITKIKHECDFCKKEHFIVKSKFEAGQHLFCSKECHLNSLSRVIEKRKCENCAKEFTFYKNGRKQEWGRFCSMKCRGIAIRGEKNKSFKGGGVIGKSNMRRISVDTLPKPTPMLEHRLIANKIIGRKLHSTEVIIHLNGNNSDNAPSNLFICGNGAGEMTKRHRGILPWPKESNLSTYK